MKKYKIKNCKKILKILKDSSKLRFKKTSDGEKSKKQVKTKDNSLKLLDTDLIYINFALKSKK